MTIFYSGAISPSHKKDGEIMHISLRLSFLIFVGFAIDKKTLMCYHFSILKR